MRANLMSQEQQEKTERMRTIKSFGSLKLKRDGRSFHIAEVKHGTLCGATEFFFAASHEDAKAEEKKLRSIEYNDLLDKYHTARGFIRDTIDYGN